jgi:TrmH family RNA methyltransferase
VKSISSRENPFFKLVKKLVDSPKERRKAGKTVLDGIHLVESYISTCGQPETIIVSVSAISNAEVAGVLKLVGRAPVIEMPDALFSLLSPVKTPTGMLALISIPELGKRRLASEPSCVLLEGIQDPGNLGTIMRSAAAAGIPVIYLSKECADAWSPKTLRAGMGAHFVLEVHENADLQETARSFHGIVLAAVLGAKQSVFEVDLKGRVAFLIGNEGVGLSPGLAAAATLQVMIPMMGKIESLNAASAASVCFFERVRQLATT